MKTLFPELANRPVAYITRDIERAMGIAVNTPGYFIVSNSTPFAKTIAGELQNILLIENETPLNTRELLSHKNTEIFLKKNKVSRAIVFKNTPQIERVCANLGLSLLNPPALLSQIIEEKISQIHWLGDLANYLPNHRVSVCGQIKWENKPFILQFNHAHTGEGTMLISEKKELEQIQRQFTNRESRIMDFVQGPVFTSNIIIGTNNILSGNISYQITGIQPFTNRPFATIGNDWGLANVILTEETRKNYENIILAVGSRMKKDGWKGLFGVDMILDNQTNKLFLIEINARQPASTTYESQLQQNSESYASENSATVFEAHISALLDLNDEQYVIIPIRDGAQIILRKNNIIDEKIIPFLSQKLKNMDLSVIQYENSKEGGDLLRIQSSSSLMRSHNSLNELGQSIAKSVSY